MQVGEIFDEKYEILKILGSGGMGTVYLAKNIKLGNLWAIKEIRKVEGAKIDLLAEPNILKKLKHPSLPGIFDIFDDEHNMYIIIDYIEGDSLEELIKKKGRIPEKTVIDWAKQICEILEYLHSQRPNPIIYRDMKPANLIMTPEGEIKLIDFGIAREHKKKATTDTTCIGTRGFAAPEQYGVSQSDERTDIYSLGVTLYYLLTGKSPNDPPYEILPVRKIDKRFSKGIEYIIGKCTEADPDKRYKSVQHLMNDLNNIRKFDDREKKAFRKKFIKSFITAATVLFSAASLIGWIGIKSIDKNEKISNVIGKVLSNGIQEYSGSLRYVYSLMFVIGIFGLSVFVISGIFFFAKSVQDRINTLSGEPEEQENNYSGSKVNSVTPKKGNGKPRANPAKTVDDELEAIRKKYNINTTAANNSGSTKDTVVLDNTAVRDTVVLNNPGIKDTVILEQNKK